MVQSEDFDTLEGVERLYQSRGDVWQVTQSPLRQVRDDVIVSLVSGRRFGRVVDFACGLGCVARRLAAQADQVLGLDGAPTAVQRAAALSRDFPNVRFRQGVLGDLVSLPPGEKIDLLVATDCFSFLPHREQDQLLLWAGGQRVPLALLEIRITDEQAPRGVGYQAGQDFETVAQVRSFARTGGYGIRRMRISRLYSPEEVAGRGAYPAPARRWGAFVARWLVAAPTAGLGLLLGRRGREDYDPWVLALRLRWMSALCALPGLRRAIEPAVAGVALLLQLEPGGAGA